MKGALSTCHGTINKVIENKFRKEDTGQYSYILKSQNYYTSLHRLNLIGANYGY